jgi:UV DNA damage endonuclease
MRLGFPVTVLGRPGLRSHDGRRPPQAHLSVSLAYLRDVLLYLADRQIRMYRLSADLVPAIGRMDDPTAEQHLARCRAELALIGEMARQHDLRLSVHVAGSVVLSAPDPVRQMRALTVLERLTRLLDGMGLGPDAVIVVHVGGYYGDRDQALHTAAASVARLSPAAQARLALENDDRRFGVTDCLWLHRRTGIRLVFDLLHHQLYNPDGLPAVEALLACLETWPPAHTPKIHLATPTTEMVRDRLNRPHPPRLNRHSHFLNPFPLMDFLRALPPVRPFDVMLEARARDLALLQFRQHLSRFAPDLVARFAIT